MHGSAGGEEGVERLAEAIHDETELTQRLVVEDVSAVKHKRRPLHLAQQRLPVQRLELIPLGENCDGMRACDRLNGTLHALHLLIRRLVLPAPRSPPFGGFLRD